MAVLTWVCQQFLVFVNIMYVSCLFLPLLSSSCLWWIDLFSPILLLLHCHHIFFFLFSLSLLGQIASLIHWWWKSLLFFNSFTQELYLYYFPICWSLISHRDLVKYHCNRFNLILSSVQYHLKLPLLYFNSCLEPLCLYRDFIFITSQFVDPLFRLVTLVSIGSCISASFVIWLTSCVILWSSSLPPIVETGFFKNKFS